MDTINIGILQLISEYLEYTNLFTINILSKNINYIFKNCVLLFFLCLLSLIRLHYIALFSLNFSHKVNTTFT